LYTKKVFNTSVFEGHLIPIVCSNVEFSKNSVIDNKTGIEVKLNKVSYEILLLCDGKKSIHDISTIMSNKYNIKNSKAFNDTINFLLEVNSKHFLDFKVDKKLNIFSKLISHIKVLKYDKRYDLKGRSFPNVLYKMLVIVFKRFSFYWLPSEMLMILIIIFANINNFSNISFLNNIFLYVNIGYIGIFSSIAIHECIHVYLYRKIVDKDMGFMAKKGFSMAFYHPNKSKSPIMQKLMGGLIVGLIGCFSVWIINVLNLKHSSPFFVFFLCYALHLVNLFPFWGDGKEICKILLYRHVIK